MEKSLLLICKKAVFGMTLMTAGAGNIFGADMSNGADNFYKSDKVILQKVTFQNQYKMGVTGNLFVPKNMNQNT